MCIRDKGEQKGQAAASLKARLLKAELIDRAELASIEQHELITRGIGYLNRVKDVTPKAGDSFLSCTVAALAGPVDEPEYRYFDTIVATRKPSTWFAGAFRPSRVTAGADRLPSERHEDRSVHPHQG